MNLQALDIALRAASAAWLLLAAMLLWQSHRSLLAARLGAWFAVGVAAYALREVSGAPAVPPGWVAPLIALSAGNSLVFWLFSRALFDDEFRWRRRYVFAWAAFGTAGLLNCYLLLPFGLSAAWALTRLLEAAPLLFSLLAVVQTFATWPGDLVERRRRLRAPLVATVAGYSAVVAIVKLSLPLGARAETGSVIEATALALVVALVISRLVSLQGRDLFGLPPALRDTVSLPAPAPVPTPAPIAPEAARDETPATSESAAAQPSPAPAPPSAEWTSEDRAQVAKLQRLMGQDRLYRLESLTIGALAARMQLPEHRLRRLINQGLGHRNFNAFLNGYRLADAKQALADAEQAEVPVLTIAMDAGFQSLGPFNRAFKSDTGMTPSEFRRLNGGAKSPPREGTG